MNDPRGHDPQQAPAPRARQAATWNRYLHFWGRRVERDVDDELAFHVEMRVRDNMARGMTEADARAEAERRLGDLPATRAACVEIDTRRERRMTRAQLVDAFAHDLRFGLRSALRQRGWTTVAVLTLALGIGANTAVFSVVNSLLLNPLPYPDADRVAVVFQEPTEGNSTGMQVMVTPQTEVVQRWREASRSFETLEPYTTTDVSLRQADGTPAVMHSAAILPSFFAFAGQRPLLGRGFADSDLREGARVAVLSEGSWRARFGGDPGIVGRTVTLDNVPWTVIGVAPGELRLPRLTQSATDVWLPLDLRRDDLHLALIGRLREGVALDMASRELDVIARRGKAAGTGNDPVRAKLVPPGRLAGQLRQPLLMLTGAVALVLLIACANVAHLLLARAATRQRELAVRVALGAGRARLLRQLLTESLLLALAGCIGGLLVGWIGLELIDALRPTTLGELAAVRLDLTTLLVTIALSVATGIAFGLVGAVHAGRHSTHEALKAGAAASAGARGQHRLRAALVVSEIALSTTLLVGAVLLVRSVAHLQSVDPGFDPSGMYALHISFPRGKDGKLVGAEAVMSELIARARRVPGISAVTTAGATPTQRQFMVGALETEDRPAPQGATAFVGSNGVEPDYFRFMRIPIVRGTTLTDTSEAAAQVVINEGAAKRLFAGEDPLGKRLRVSFNGQGPWYTVVGIAADARTAGLDDDPSEPLLYFAAAGAYSKSLLVRTDGTGDPIPMLRKLAASIDPNLPPASIQSVSDALSSDIAGKRFTMALLGAFSALALVLAAVGLYGVMSYAVAQRTREIGIRIALGATRRTIARSVLRQGALLAVAGVAIGLVTASWATRLLQDNLFGVSRTDAASFVVAAVVLLATAIGACIVPMNRAVSVDPQIAMRAD